MMIRILAGAVSISCFACLAITAQSADPPQTSQTRARSQKTAPAAKTAKQFLKLLDESTGPVRLNRLPAAEAKKVGLELLKRYPFKDVNKSLKYEKKSAPRQPGTVITPKVEKHLKAREKSEGVHIYARSMRVLALRRLHAGKVADFVNRQGFGKSRLPAPSPASLRIPNAPEIPLVSRNPSAGNRQSTVQLPTTIAAASNNKQRLPAREEVEVMSNNLPLWFALPNRSGHVKDRDHVAGFKSHGFMTRPKLRPALRGKKRANSDTWVLERMELVSLLKHETPVAYVTDNLPRMEDVDDAKTRKLDRFEFRALKELRAGKDVVIQSHLNRLNMVGSVRATHDCMQCHSVERGQMLGAFSYSLVRKRAHPMRDKAK